MSSYENRINLLDETINEIKSTYETTEDLSNFLHQTDDKNGYTILHTLINCGKSRIPMLKLLRAQLIPEDIYQSLKNIRSNNGKTFVELTIDPDPNCTQAWMKNQFAKYIDAQMSIDDNFNIDDASAISNLLKGKGHCNGFASLWLQLFLDGRETEYKRIFDPIKNWDGLDTSFIKKDLEIINNANMQRLNGFVSSDEYNYIYNSTLLSKFEIGISLIREYTQDIKFKDSALRHEFIEMNHIKKKAYPENDCIDWFDDNQNAEVFNCTEGTARLVHQQSKNFFHGQENAHKVWDEDSYQKEDKIQVSLNNDDAIEAIEDIMTKYINAYDIDSPKGFLIHSSDHSIALGYKDNTIMLFDSNFSAEYYQNYSSNEIQTLCEDIIKQANLDGSGNLEQKSGKIRAIPVS